MKVVFPNTCAYSTLNKMEVFIEDLPTNVNPKPFGITRLSRCGIAAVRKFLCTFTYAIKLYDKSSYS